MAVADVNRSLDGQEAPLDLQGRRACVRHPDLDHHSRQPVHGRPIETGLSRLGTVRTVGATLRRGNPLGERWLGSIEERTRQDWHGPPDRQRRDGPSHRWSSWTSSASRIRSQTSPADAAWYRLSESSPACTVIVARNGIGCAGSRHVRTTITTESATSISSGVKHALGRRLEGMQRVGQVRATPTRRVRSGATTRRMRIRGARDRCLPPRPWLG